MDQDSGPIVETARDFAALLPDGGALLALDLGTQTIGLATCDSGSASGRERAAAPTAAATPVRLRRAAGAAACAGGAGTSR